MYRAAPPRGGPVAGGSHANSAYRHILYIISCMCVCVCVSLSLFLSLSLDPRLCAVAPSRLHACSLATPSCSHMSSLSSRMQASLALYIHI